MLSYSFPAKTKDMAAWRSAFLHLVRCPLTNAQPEQDDLGRGRSDELSHHSSEGVNSAAPGVCC